MERIVLTKEELAKLIGEEDVTTMLPQELT